MNKTMIMEILKKAGLFASTVAVGATIMTWNGGGIIDNAMSKLGELTGQLEMFKGNESKLVTKINDLKSEIATLEETIANGVNGADKEALDQELTSLQTQLAEAEKKYNEDIAKANAEIQAANDKAAELQQALDNFNTNTEEFTPMTQMQINDIVGIVQDGDVWNYTQYRYNNGSIKLEVKANEEGKFVLTNLNNQNDAQPLNVMYMGIIKTIHPNTTMEFDIVEGQLIKVLDEKGIEKANITIQR